MNCDERAPRGLSPRNLYKAAAVYTRFGWKRTCPGGGMAAGETELCGSSAGGLPLGCGVGYKAGRRPTVASDFIAQANPIAPTAAAAAPVAIPQRSRTQAFLQGAGTGYAYQALVMVLGLWLTPFLLRHLGQRDYGLWLVGTQLFGYLALLDLGVTARLPREATYATGRRGASPGSAAAADPWELAELVGRVLRIAQCQTPVMALGAALLWRFNPAASSQLRGLLD